MIKGRRSLSAVFGGLALLGVSASSLSQDSTSNPDSILDLLNQATPEQIIEVRKRLDALLKAKEQRPNGPVVGSAQTKYVNFRGGQATQTVSLVTGRLSVIGIYDRLSAPLPIEELRYSARDAFEVFTRAEGANTFTIMPLKEYATGNLVVYIKGETEPLVLDLDTTEKNYFSKFNVQLNILSTESREKQQTAQPTPLDASLTNKYTKFMDGRPPAGATSIGIEADGFNEAWFFQNELIVLSENQIYSPAPRARFRTPDSLTLYVFDRVHQVVLATQQGNLVVSQVKYE